MVVIILFGFLAVVFACLSQKGKVPIANVGDNVTEYTYEKFSGFLFTISFLLLAVPCFFCGEGTDMPVYVQLYKSATFENLIDPSIEAGYVLLNILLRVFFKNAYIGLGIIKVLSIFFIYKSIYMLRERLNLGFSVLSYVVLLYIFNFHLLRMLLAVGIIFLALSYELLGYSKKAIFWMVVAFFFHYTSVIVLLTYLIYKLLGKEMTVLKITIFSFILALIYGGITPILQILTSSINAFSKYEIYLNSANADTGIVQIVLFIPIVYIFINTYRQGLRDKFYALNAVFSIMLFFLGMLGYLFPVISRTTYYFFWLAVVFFAATPLIDDKCIFELGRKRINSITVASVLYLMMQAMITYILNDAFVSNGITQYTLWWNM